MRGLLEEAALTGLATAYDGAHLLPIIFSTSIPLFPMLFGTVIEYPYDSGGHMGPVPQSHQGRQRSSACRSSDSKEEHDIVYGNGTARSATPGRPLSAKPSARLGIVTFLPWQSMPDRLTRGIEVRPAGPLDLIPHTSYYVEYSFV